MLKSTEFHTNKKALTHTCDVHIVSPRLDCSCHNRGSDPRVWPCSGKHDIGLSRQRLHRGGIAQVTNQDGGVEDLGAVFVGELTAQGLQTLARAAGHCPAQRAAVVADSMLAYQAAGEAGGSCREEGGGDHQGGGVRWGGWRLGGIREEREPRGNWGQNWARYRYGSLRRYTILAPYDHLEGLLRHCLPLRTVGQISGSHDLSNGARLIQNALLNWRSQLSVYSS
jgi:hypothetical protein